MNESRGTLPRAEGGIERAPRRLFRARFIHPSRTLSMLRTVSAPLLLAISLLVTPSLSAQTGVGPGPHGTVLVGPAGSPQGGHYFGGLHASYSMGRWGGALQGHLGSGNGFTSRLLVAGPTVRFGVHPRVDLEIMAGAAYYAEQLGETDRSGSVTAPAAGVLVRFVTGPVHLAIGLTGWTADYTDEIATNPVPVDGLRFVVGVGR